MNAHRGEMGAGFTRLGKAAKRLPFGEIRFLRLKAPGGAF
jgi:hypothetical protein